MILLAAACLVWIALLSLGIVWLMGMGISAGWIIAGALLFALVVWIVVMAGEFHNAIDLTGDFESEDCGLHADGNVTSVLPHFRTSDSRTDSAFTGRGGVKSARRNKTLIGKPRRQRPNRVR